MNLKYQEVLRQCLEAMISLLLPVVTICTPNAKEAKKMAPKADSIDACAQEIMGYGADFVLITGSQNMAEKTVNSFYGNYRRLESFSWKKYHSKYHGSGCTLAASIAGLLAQGLEAFSAIHQAQEYTAECLKHGYRIGMGQYLPNRLFWAREPEFEYDVRKSVN